MRKILALAFTLLLIGISPADALRLRGGGATVSASQTIASIALSNNTFVGGSASGTVVGTLTVTMSPASPAFSGTLAITSTGTDHSSTACTSTNGTNFKTVSTSLELNTTLSAGSYPGMCVTASQGGLASLTQAFTITGSAAQTMAVPSPVLSNTTYTPNSPNAVVGTLSVTMSPSSPASTSALTVSGANSGGFQLVGSGCTNISLGSCTLETNSGGTTGAGPFTDVTLVATQAGISNSPQSITPTLTGTSSTQVLLELSLQPPVGFTGNVADLRDATTATQTFTNVGWPMTGETFCAANPPCTWSHAYNMGTLANPSGVTLDATPGVAPWPVAATTSTSSPTLTFYASNVPNAAISNGMLIRDLTHPSFITAGTTVIGKTLTGSPWTVTMSANAATLIPINDAIQFYTLAQEPTVNFPGLGGYPTAHFSGGQQMCTQIIGGGQGNAPAQNTQPVAYTAIARRTGSSGLQTVIDSDPQGAGASYNWLGYGTAASSMTSTFLGNSNTATGTSDGNYNSLYAETISSGLQTANLFINGTSKGNVSTPGTTGFFQQQVCIGARADGSSPLTGDIADVSIVNAGTTTGGPGTSPEGTVFTMQQAAWTSQPTGQSQLPDMAFVVNYGSTSAVNPPFRAGLGFGYNDIPSGHVLTASVGGNPITFTAGQKASGANGNVQYLTMLGTLPSTTIPGSLGISSITSSGTTATVTTASPHGLATTCGTSTSCEMVILGDTTHPGYDGMFPVTYTGASTFTYTMRQTQSGTPASGTLTAYYAAIVNLNQTAGSFNTTLPGGKTLGQVVTDATTNFDDPGVLYTNVVAQGGQFGCTGTWQMDANTIYGLGTTPAETGYYRSIDTGPAAAENDLMAPMQDTSCNGSNLSSITVSGDVATAAFSTPFNFSQMPIVTTTAHIAGTTLTLDNIVSNGLIAPGSLVSCSGCDPATTVVALLTGTGSFPSTYSVTPSQTVTSQAMSANNNQYYINLSGWGTNAPSGQFLATATGRNTLVFPVTGGTVSSTATGTIVVDDMAMNAEINETVRLNSSTGAVTRIEFKAFLDEGRRFRQNRQFTGNLALTLNGTPVRSWGGNSGDGNTFSVAPSAVNTSTDLITVGPNGLADGQAVTVCSSGAVPAPLVACNQPITSITVAGGANNQTATVVVPNNFGLTNQSAIISGAVPAALNGRWPIINATSSQFTLDLIGTNIATGVASSPGTVTPIYYTKQGTGAPNLTTIALYTDQDIASSQTNQSGFINFSTQGSGTITITGNVTINPYTSNSLAGQFADYDWILGHSGTLGGNPTLMAIPDTSLLRKGKMVGAYDLSVVMANATVGYAHIYAPNVLGSCLGGINNTGFHYCYGSVFNEPQADRLSQPWDRFGYVLVARADAEAQGAWGTHFLDNTNYRPLAVNANTYSGLNTAFWSSVNYDNGNWTYGSQDWPIPDNLSIVFGGRQYPGATPGDSHWYQNSTLNYIMDGGEAAQRQLIAEANFIGITTKFPTQQTTFLEFRGLTCTATGHTSYAGFNGNQPRSWLPEMTLMGSAALFAADAFSEKQYAEDVLDDDATEMMCLTRGLKGNFLQSGAGNSWQSVSGSCPGVGLFSNSSLCGSGIFQTNNNPSNYGMFQIAYGASGFAAAYEWWPSANMAEAAYEPGRWIDILGDQWACPQAGAAFDMRAVNPTPSDTVTQNVGWIPGNQLAQQYPGWVGLIFLADGVHAELLYNGVSSTPFLINGVDQLWAASDGDGAGQGYNNTTPATTNTLFYTQNGVEGPTRNAPGHDTYTLSTDAGNTSPVTWTASMPNSTLNGSITNSQTTVPLNTSISFAAPDGGPSILLAQVDSELIQLSNPTRVGNITASITSGTLNCTATCTNIAIGEQVTWANNGFDSSRGKPPLFVTGGSGSTWTLSNAGENDASQTMVMWPTTSSLTVASSGRGAFGTTAATHSTGATAQIYMAVVPWGITENRTGSNCPVNALSGIITTPVYANGTTVQDGTMGDYIQAAAMYAYAGLMPPTAFNRLATIMNLESAGGGPYGLAGYARASVMEWSGTYP